MRHHWRPRHARGTGRGPVRVVDRPAARRGPDAASGDGAPGTPNRQRAGAGQPGGVRFQRGHATMKLTSFETFTELARRSTFVPVVKEVVADLLTPVSAFLKVAEHSDYAFL